MEGENIIFTNDQIDIEDLPKISTIEYKPIQNNHLYISYISIAIFFSLLLAGTLVVLSFSGDLISRTTVYALIAWPTLIGLSMLLIYFGFKKKKYAIRQHDLVFRSGLIFHSITTVPFTRIQHVEIKKGVIDDLFGLSRLKVFTAGGAASDLTIPGLLPEESQKIKSFILNNIALDEEE